MTTTLHEKPTEQQETCNGAEFDAHHRARAEELLAIPSSLVQSIDVAAASMRACLCTHSHSRLAVGTCQLAGWRWMPLQGRRQGTFCRAGLWV